MNNSTRGSLSTKNIGKQRGSMLLSLLLFGAIGISQAQNVGVNSTGQTPNASAILDLNTGNTFGVGSSKGLLIPNVALTGNNDGTTIIAPAVSLIVYVPALSGLTPAGYYYNSGLTNAPVWKQLGAGAAGGSYVKDSAWLLTGNFGTTPGTNYIGTNDAKDLVFKTNSTEDMRISHANGALGINETAPTQLLEVSTNLAGNAGNWNKGFPANSGTTENGILRLEPSTEAVGGFGEALDFGMNTDGAPEYSYGWIQATNKTNLSFHYVLLLNPNGGNVGIGTGTVESPTGNPQRQLEIGGLTNTERIDGLATGGSFITTPSAATDKLLYADLNGDVRAVTPGANNTVLSLNGSGVPTWTTFTDWLTLGNAGTTPGTNFLGTTDAEALEFKVNNTQAGWIDYSNAATGTGTYANSFYGFGAGAALSGATGAVNNTAIGYNALSSANTSGNDFNNVAVGTNALEKNTGGYQQNAIGVGALQNNTSGINNSADGYEALFSNTTGNNNTADGQYALNLNTSGSQNTALGMYALRYYGTPSGNTAVGYNALQGSVTTASNTGGSNTAVGLTALGNNTSGSSNTAMGNNALTANTSGTNNNAFGNQALAANTTGTWSTAIGDFALQKSNANQQLGIGYEAGQNSTAGNAFAIGYEALQTNVSGTNNEAVGIQALELSSGNGVTGSENTAIGQTAMQENTSGSWNTALGINSLLRNTSGNDNVQIGAYPYTTTPAATASDNTSVGYQAAENITTGGQSVAMGSLAMTNTTTGSNSVGIGYSALNANIAGSNNTAVGWEALTVNTASNNTAIGQGAMFDNISGTQNSAVGVGCLSQNTSGSFNTAMGQQSMQGNTIGTNNTAYGTYSLFSNTTATDNVAIGLSALKNQTFSNANATYSSNNIAIGSNALFNNNPTTTANGIDNIAVGITALQNNTTGAKNVAIGFQAVQDNVTQNGITAVGYEAMMYSNSTAGGFTPGNTAFGYQALEGSATPASNTGTVNTAIGYGTLSADAGGTGNTAVGYDALLGNTSGGSNTVVGDFSMPNNTGGNNNVAVGDNISVTGSTSFITAVGSQALKNTTGSNNTAVGYQALLTNTSGSGNTAIGYQANVASAALANATAIGNGASVLASNNIQLGNTASTRLVFSNYYGVIDATQATDNYYFGINQNYGVAGNNDAGTNNIAIGMSALGSAIAGTIGNVAIGDYTCGPMGSGGAGGMYNSVVGNFSGRWIGSGGSSTGVGAATNFYTVKAVGNTTLGKSAGYGITTGSLNTVVGFLAMGSGWVSDHFYTGYANTVMGYNALTLDQLAANSTTEVGSNTAIGANSLRMTTYASQNTALGDSAGFNISTGGNNLMAGYKAGSVETTGTNNTYIGYNANPSAAGFTNATALGNGATAIGSNSVTLGNSSVASVYIPGYKTIGSMYYTSAASGLLTPIPVGANGTFLTMNSSGVPTFAAYTDWLTTGNSGNPGENSPGWNTKFIGTNDYAPLVFEINGAIAGFMDDDGEVNLGALAGSQDFPNSNAGSTGIGYQALSLAAPLDGAVDNTAVGCYSQQSADASDNTSVGYFSLISNTIGNENTAMGSYGMSGNSSGTNNTAIGFRALSSNQTGSNITAVGSGADVGGDGLSNATAIGNGAVVNTSNTMMFGNSSITDNFFTGLVHATCGVLVCSDARYKKNISVIPDALSNVLKLQPVNYYLKTADELAADGVKSSAFKGGDDKEKQIGFIAQQIEPLFPAVVHTDLEGFKSVDYSKLTPVLVKAMQEQQHMIDSLKTANVELKGTVKDLKTAQVNMSDKMNQMQSSVAKDQADIAELKKMIYLSTQSAEVKK